MLKLLAVICSLFVVCPFPARGKAGRGRGVTACLDTEQLSKAEPSRICQPTMPRSLRCPSAAEGERRIWFCHPHLQEQTSSRGYVPCPDGSAPAWPHRGFSRDISSCVVLVFPSQSPFTHTGTAQPAESWSVLLHIYAPVHPTVT